MKNDDLKNKLSPEAYSVTQEKGTEEPFSGEYVDCKDDGTYSCVVCGNELFSSDTKFDSGSGWPSFYDVVKEVNVTLKDDSSHGMERVEATCASCNAHLGHVFNDGPQEKTGKRYCINSVALDFKKKSTQ